MTSQPLDSANLTREERELLFNVAAERARRSQDALRIYRPLDYQMAFYLTAASERLILGGNRCLGGETEIYDPVLDKHLRVDEIDQPFHVMSKNPDTGELEMAEAGVPFVKGRDRLYRITLSNGESFVASASHLLLRADLLWAPVGDVLPQGSSSFPLHSSSDACPYGFPKDAGHCSHREIGSRDDYQIDHHSYGGQLQLLPAVSRESVPSQGGALEYSQHGLRLDDRGGVKEYTLTCLPAVRPSNLGADLQMAAHASAFGTHVSSQPYSPAFGAFQVDPQSAGVLARLPHTTYASSQRASRCGYESPSDSPLDSSSLVITSYEYLRQDDIWDFEVADSHNYILGGVVHHNSGKSMCSFAETASAATGIPITGSDGAEVTYRYPTDRPLIIWCIGRDESHIGRVIHRMLFEPRAFKVIWDEELHQWRAWQPWNERDKDKEHLTRFAPPLIPPRMIDLKGWAWKDRARKVFNVCRLKSRWKRYKTGTEIHAFSSGANVPMGDPVDLIHIDEDIEKPEYVAEWQARLSDTRGRLTWSAWPWNKNDALIDLSARADDQVEREKPDVTKIVLKFSDNPYIHADEKRKRLEGWTEEERRSRDLGEFLTDSILMYPTFSPDVHGIPRQIAMDLPDNPIYEVEREISRLGNSVPLDWTNYLVLDPGHTSPGVLFAAIPPPGSLGDHIVIWDEMLPKGASADELARQVSERAGDRMWEAFIIDGRAGRQTPMGGVQTIQEQYAMAFKKHRLTSHLTGSDFVRGSDNVLGRAERVRNMLSIRSDGSTKLLFISSRIPHLRSQMSKYKKKASPQTGIQDTPIPKHNDLPNCLEYLCAYSPEYVFPRDEKRLDTPAMQEYRKWKKKDKGKAGKHFYMGAGDRPAPSPLSL